MYGTDPFSAQHATGDGQITVPSIFGALPYPKSASVDPPLDTLITFRFSPSSSSSSHGRPSLLDCSVIGPNNETVYRVASSTTPERGGFVTTLNAVRTGNAVAVVDWRSHPTVDMQGLGGKQFVGQWLGLSSDKRSRVMTYGGVQYSWAPVDRFLMLFAPGSSEWLARVTKHYDTVVLELTRRALEHGLIDVAVLATTLLQSGKNID